MKRLVSFLYAVILMTVIPFDAFANITVYVYSPNNDVYLHAWTADGDINGAWGSGQKMTTTETINGMTFYKQEMTTDRESCSLLFHDNNGNQTADISGITDGTFLFYNGGSNGGKLIVYRGNCIPSTGVIDTGWTSEEALTMKSDGHFHITQKADIQKNTIIDFKLVIGGVWYGPGSESQFIDFSTTYTAIAPDTQYANYRIAADWSKQYEQFDIDVWKDGNDWKMKVTPQNSLCKDRRMYHRTECYMGRPQSRSGNEL